MPTFTDRSEYERAIGLMNYYRFANPPIKYSAFVDLSDSQQNSILKSLKDKDDQLVTIITFVLMPNHFHFTLKQLVDGGISKFMSDFTNSFTRYVNTKKKRPGPIFQGTFKSVLIDSEEQLLHLSRYQHLNPLTDGVVTRFEELVIYPYSSFNNYLGKKIYDFVDSEAVLAFFNDNQTYRKFVENQKDYQRRLGQIKKIVLE